MVQFYCCLFFECVVLGAWIKGIVCLIKVWIKAIVFILFSAWQQRKNDGNIGCAALGCVHQVLTRTSNQWMYVSSAMFVYWSSTSLLFMSQPIHHLHYSCRHPYISALALVFTKQRWRAWRLTSLCGAFHLLQGLKIIIIIIIMIMVIIMSIFLECLSMWNMLSCAEQVQIQNYKTCGYKTLKRAGVQIIILKHPTKPIKEYP